MNRCGMHFIYNTIIFWDHVMVVWAENCQTPTHLLQ